MASANSQMGFDVTPLTTLISEISIAIAFFFVGMGRGGSAEAQGQVM